MTWVLFLLVIEIAIMLIICGVTDVDYTSPGFITLCMYILSTLCVLYNTTYWNVNFSLDAFMLVSLGLLVVALSEMVAKSLCRKRIYWVDRTAQQISDPIKIGEGTIVIFDLVSFFMMVYFVYDVFRVGGGGITSISIVKQSAELSVSFIGKICLRVGMILPYPCIYILMHNMILCGEKITANWKLLIPLISSLAIIFFNGSRGPYIYMVFAAYIYLVMFERYKRGWKKIQLRKYFKRIVALIILFVFVFYFTAQIVKGYAITDTFMQYITFYFGSPIHLLSKLLDNPSKAYPYEYSIPGVNVFVSFFEELHKFGLFDQEVHLGQTGFMYIGGSAIGGGNAYSMFGSIYNDYGFTGSLLFIFVYYLVIDIYYYKNIKYCKTIVTSQKKLLVAGYFSYLVFMTFFVNPVIYLKLQTILEVIVLLVFFRVLTRLKIIIHR